MDKVSTIFLAGSLIIIMLGMGLSLVLDDFKKILVTPKAIFVGLTNQLIIVPLVGFALTMVFPLKPEIAIGIMILAACPGGPTSNLISHLAKGDVALSVSLTAFSSFITILTIPFIVNFALTRFLDAGQMIELPIIETIMQIFIIIVIPITIGMVIRKYKESFALKMENPVRKASAIVIALVIFGVIYKERANLVSYFQQAGVVALLLNSITMLIGYFSARIFKIKDRRAVSISIESGIQNGTLAITIAVVILGNTTFAIVPAIYSLLMFFTGGVAIYFGVRRNKKQEA